MVLMAASCTNESQDSSVISSNEQDLAPVRVHLDGFAVSQQDFSESQTRAVQDVADYNGIKTVTLAFYKSDGTLQYSASQSRENMPDGKTFGEFTLGLPMGSYTMVVIASGSAYPMTLNSMSEAVFDTQEVRVRDTFLAKQTVDVTTNTALDLTATLSRVISKLQVDSSDGRTSDVSNVRMTFSAGGQGVNPLNGFALTDAGFSNTVSITTSVGSISQSASNLFLATDEQTMNVTIETLDADGAVLFSKTINDVPFKRNRITKLTGAMYTNEAISGTFKVETAWLDEYNANL